MTDEDRELSKLVKAEVQGAVDSAADKLAKDKTHAKLVDEIVEASNDVVEAVKGLDVELILTVAEGKYTFVKLPRDWRVYVFRYNQKWLTIEAGHRAVLALMQEVKELEERLDEHAIDGSWFRGKK